MFIFFTSLLALTDSLNCPFDCNFIRKNIKYLPILISYVLEMIFCLSAKKTNLKFYIYQLFQFNAQKVIIINIK